MALKDYQTTSWARGYREYDDRAINDLAWRKYSNHLLRICRSFRKKIDVLDIACGTGRFFCSLENVNELYGLDNSLAMLEEAKDPVNNQKVLENVKNISLVQGDFKKINTIFGNKKFDFIFSIGMINEYGPTTVADINFFDNLWDITKNDGILFLSICHHKNDVMSMIRSSKLSNASVIKQDTLRDEKSDKLIIEIKK